MGESKQASRRRSLPASTPGAIARAASISVVEEGVEHCHFGDAIDRKSIACAARRMVSGLRRVLDAKRGFSCSRQ